MDKRGQEVKYIKEKDLANIREYLIERNKIPFLTLVNVGVNVGLRISDLSKIKFEHITKNNTIELVETKTKKKRTINLNKTSQNAINQVKIYYEKLGYPSDKGYIFKSVSRFHVCHKLDKPITIVGVSKEFNRIRDMLGIEYPIASHSLRKTWGYNVYKGTRDIALLMIAFNHSSAQQTLKYIGIEGENISAIYKKFEI